MSRNRCRNIAAIAAVYAPRLAELEAEVERLDVTVSAAEQRASQSEHRLHSFRQSRASTSKALSEFIRLAHPNCGQTTPLYL